MSVGSIWREQVVKLWHVAVPGFLIALMVAQIAEAGSYQNTQFGFTVDVPDGAPTCPAELREYGDGLDIFLDDGPDGCDELLNRPFVGVYGTYNAMFDPSPEAHVNSLCDGDDGRITAPPDGLTIDERHSAACRLEGDDGWIEIVVVAQNAESYEADTSPPQVLAGINYAVMLWTRPDRYRADFAQFQSILSTVRLFDPE